MQPVNSPHLLSFPLAHSACLAHTHAYTQAADVQYLLYYSRISGEDTHGSLPVSSLVPTAFVLKHFLIWMRNFQIVHFYAFCFSDFKNLSDTLFLFPKSGFFLSSPTHPPLLSLPSIPLLPSLSLPVELCP